MCFDWHYDRTIVSISIIDVRFLEAQLLKGARVQLVETSFPRPNGGQSRLEGMCRGCQMLRGFGSLTPCCELSNLIPAKLGERGNLGNRSLGVIRLQS